MTHIRRFLVVGLVCVAATLVLREAGGAESAARPARPQPRELLSVRPPNRTTLQLLSGPGDAPGQHCVSVQQIDVGGGICLTDWDLSKLDQPLVYVTRGRTSPVTREGRPAAGPPSGDVVVLVVGRAGRDIVVSPVPASRGAARVAPQPLETIDDAEGVSVRGRRVDIGVAYLAPDAFPFAVGVDTALQFEYGSGQ